jgi:hypothetical protein
MNCSLTKAYALITSAIAMLAAAIALAVIFFNIPGLIAAIGLVIAVTGIPFTDLGMVAQIRIALREYVTCVGPSDRCPIAPSIDVLGTVPMIIGVGSWSMALVLQISGAGFLASWILAWVGLPLIAAGEALKIAGSLLVAAGAVMLAGLLTQVRTYEVCRNSETPPVGPIG